MSESQAGYEILTTLSVCRWPVILYVSSSLSVLMHCRRATMLRPPPATGTQPPDPSSRHITCAFTCLITAPSSFLHHNHHELHQNDNNSHHAKLKLNPKEQENWRNTTEDITDKVYRAKTLASKTGQFFKIIHSLVYWELSITDC